MAQDLDYISKESLMRKPIEPGTQDRRENDDDLVDSHEKTEGEMLPSDQIKNAQASGDGSLRRADPSIYNRINNDNIVY